MKKIINKNQYCNSLTSYSRWKTREVLIGDVSLGGDNPIRVQSMTTTDTMDTKGTVEQSIRMIDAGCEYVRITAPGRKEAENLQNIKVQLLKNVYTGISLRLNRLLNDKLPENFDNIYIPGFNKKTEDNVFGAGFNYTLSYNIPLMSKKK